MSQIEKSIELDCAPGNLRPGDLILSVVAGTALEGRPEAQPDATVMRLFGNWRWEFPGVPDDVWLSIRPVLEERVKKLYHGGLIRYGSW
jgi:hypothetical protein